MTRRHETPAERAARFGPIPGYDESKLPKPKVGRPPGTPGIVTRFIEYKCGECGGEFAKEDLLVKRVQFMTLGRNGKNVRSRAVAWMCRPCAEADPQWNVPSMRSPGMRSASDASEEA